MMTCNSIRSPIVTEGQFWKELRARINNLAQAGTGPKFPGWCDWLDPKSYSSRGVSARITGRALFIDHGRTSKWRLTLIVNHSIAAFDELDWSELEELLPTQDDSAWLLVDGERLTIELPPAAR